MNKAVKNKQTYFEKYLEIAPFSLALWRAVEAKELRRIKRRFKYQRPILDVGCGFGEFAGVFFESMIEVGIDISPTDLLRAAQGKTYKNLYAEDARELSFAANSFATVISISVLEHIPGVEKAIQEIYRVLKPGGLFIATIPTDELYSCLLYPMLFEKLRLRGFAQWYFRLYNRVFKHINLWSQKKWLQLLKGAGFEVIHSEKIIPAKTTRIFDLFLITALPSQVGRWLFGNRLIWGLSWKKRLLRRIFEPLIQLKETGGSNIVIVAQKSK